MKSGKEPSAVVRTYGQGAAEGLTAGCCLRARPPPCSALAEKAVFHDQQDNGRGLFVRATRREIAKGAGIGSLDTVDRSLARLQGLGFIDVERSRGVNDGSIIQIKSPEQHPQSEEKAWQKIANVLEQSADLMRRQGRNLSPNQLIQWSQLADRAFRLVSTTKNRES